MRNADCGLVAQLSKTACIHNVTFGCSPRGDSLWVRGGCRGRFRCRASLDPVECGDWHGWASDSACACAVAANRRNVRQPRGATRSTGSYLHCSTLHDACLTVGEATPACSRDCEIRSFRIDAYGASAASEVSDLLAQRAAILDPLQSFQLRHLERDIFAAGPGATLPAVFPWRPSLHMIWPYFEPGFGDVVMRSMAALGAALHEGGLAAVDELGISGMRYSRLIEPLTRAVRVCSFERATDGLPRCAQACYKELSVCAPGVLAGKRRPKSAPAAPERIGIVRGKEAWLGQAALDALMGFPAPPLSGRSRFRTFGELRVTFARRQGRRYLTNVDELLARCQSARVAGWAIRCAAHDLGRLGNATVPTLRGTDVLVSMHGGDMANGLRLLPGRTAVELVNCGFERAHWEWRDAYRLLLLPTVRHVCLLLPPAPDAGLGSNSSCGGAADGGGGGAGGGAGGGTDPPAAGGPGSWDRQLAKASWNVDSRLPWEMLEPTLRAIVERAVARHREAGRRPGGRGGRDGLHGRGRGRWRAVG